jgi:fatty acid desaturase
MEDDDEDDDDDAASSTDDDSVSTSASSATGASRTRDNLPIVCCCVVILLLSYAILVAREVFYWQWLLVASLVGVNGLLQRNLQHPRRRQQQRTCGHTSQKSTPSWLAISLLFCALEQFL